ncbi:hypothetical protein [Fimbriiglobus ruber]|nr:hypothetical protein [Fimbriiglobus ruber]
MPIVNGMLSGGVLIATLAGAVVNKPEIPPRGMQSPGPGKIVVVGPEKSVTQVVPSPTFYADLLPDLQAVEIESVTTDKLTGKNRPITWIPTQFPAGLDLSVSPSRQPFCSPCVTTCLSAGQCPILSHVLASNAHANAPRHPIAVVIPPSPTAKEQTVVGILDTHQRKRWGQTDEAVFYDRTHMKRLLLCIYGGTIDTMPVDDYAISMIENDFMASNMMSSLLLSLSAIQALWRLSDDERNREWHPREMKRFDPQVAAGFNAFSALTTKAMLETRRDDRRTVVDSPTNFQVELDASVRPAAQASSLFDNLSAHRPLPRSVPPAVVVQDSHDRLGYVVPKQDLSGLEAVELWITTDGQTWRVAATAQPGEPLAADFGADGVYGVRFGFVRPGNKGAGWPSPNAPQPGDAPQMTVEVDSLRSEKHSAGRVIAPRPDPAHIFSAGPWWSTGTSEDGQSDEADRKQIFSFFVGWFGGQ